MASPVIDPCPSCGATTPDDARFCPACGGRLVQPACLPEERKTVTTLFCDLVASTAMGEQADPEDVDACLRAFGAMSRGVIELYGGCVEKFIGDAVVGVFGVPAVHEDDPERAVRAALRLTDEVRRLQRPDGSPMQARAGVTTGELFVTHDVDPLQGNGFVVGDALNTAQRLEASAPCGAVVVAELTHRLTERVVSYEDLPPLAAKGKSGPLRRWVARGLVARLGEEPPDDRSSPLVGRETELAVLRDHLQRAIAGRSPQTVLVVGGPGIGKTRLVRELSTLVGHGPEMVTWRHGRCVPYGEDRTYWALREIVRSHAGILETHDAGRASELLERAVNEGPDHRWLCDRLRLLVGLDASDADPSENHAGWLRFLGDVAARRPLVMVLEDLHWADDALLEFMDYVALNAADIPLLMIGTTRPNLFEQHHVFAASGDRVTRLDLDPLSDEQTADLIAALPEAVGLEATLVESIARRAEGNPFFAEELARLVAGAGRDGAETAGLSLPHSVQAVLAARVDALSPAAKATLGDASVIGARFWPAALAALADGGPSAVAVGLPELADKSLVQAVRASSLDGAEEYSFRHGLMRDVAYGQLPRGVRAVKHAAFARWFEAWVGDRARGDLSDVLADHYAAAAALARASGENELLASVENKAVEYLGISGDRAMGLDASAAARHFSRALELGGQDQGGRIPLLLKWAEALVQEGSYAEAVQALREAVLGLRDAGRVRQAAVALTRLSEIRYAIGEAGVMEPLREAMALLQDDEPSAEMATVLARLGKALWFGGEPRAGLEAVERALSLTSELGLPEPAAVLGWRGGIRCTLGDPDGFDDYRRAISAAEQQGLERERAIICFNCSDALLAEQGPVAAAAALEDGIEWARRRLRERMGADALPTEHRSPPPVWDAESVRPLTVNLIEALGLMGRWDEALAKATELAPQLERGRAGVALLIVRVQQAVLSAYRGDAGSAAAIAEWLEARARTSDIPWMKAYAALSSAPVRLRLGERAAGLDTLSQWVALSPPGSGPNYALYLPEAVRAAIGAGAPELAGRLDAGLRPMLPVQQQVLATTKALLAEQSGEYEQAVAGFIDAAARWHAFGVPYEEGQALLGLGRCLAALGRAPEAAAPLIGARNVFGRLGARPAFAEADRRLDGLRRD